MSFIKIRPRNRSDAARNLTRGDRHLLSRMDAQLAELDRRVAQLIDLDSAASEKLISIASLETCQVWGLPFARLNLEQTVQVVDRLIASREPGYFITANLHYLMLTDRMPELHEINRGASFIVADGMPIVWRSRWSKNPLPERVAGSELIWVLCHWAAKQGYRVFFLGAAPGIAQQAADKLAQRYEGLQIVGVESPPFRPLTNDEEDGLIGRIRDAEPDVLFVAFGQPKGEIWLAKNYLRLGVPVGVQVGASFDFVAGNVKRAPRFLQTVGLEWLYRAATDPKRLAPRYWDNAKFLAGAIGRELAAAMCLARRSPDHFRDTAPPGTSPADSGIGF
jgi:N-acetylglucosaminyldiphosphoundecaprenol N-acetyl-beta-D-mannosaminyltransferase